MKPFRIRTTKPRTLWTIDTQSLHLLQYTLDLAVQSSIGVFVSDVIGEVSLNAAQFLVAFLSETELTSDHCLERWVQVGFRVSVGGDF